MPARFDAVERLALEVLRKSKLFIETEFLALAQALEGVHRATMSTSGTDRVTPKTIRKALRTTLDSLPIPAELKERICTSMMHLMIRISLLD